MKDFFTNVLGIGLVALVFFLLSSAYSSDGGLEKDEARAEAAAYSAELQKEGYDSGYSEGYDQGYHKGYDEGIDHGYDAGYEYGYEEGYIDCLKHYGKEKDIEKFLERDEWKVE